MRDEHPEVQRLRILVVDDEENIRFALSACLESDGHNVVAVGTIESALEKCASSAFDLIFLDLRLGTQNGLHYIKTLLTESPWVRIIVITAYASIDTAVDAMKLGASDYVSKPFEAAQIRHLTQKVAEHRLLERKYQSLQKTLGYLDPEADFPTSSPIWRDSIEFARKISTANAPILIRGEAGTGRGRLARAIHEWSRRNQGPYVSMSFEGQTVDEIEAELFGSGPKIGAVAYCHGGTLMLDEISNLPLLLQPRLVRLLHDKEFELQDQFTQHSVDVRVIATTCADLRRETESGRFRQDLLMALSVTQLNIPALRERTEDIGLLTDRYLAHFAREHHRPIISLSRDAAFFLRTHSWPGNIRELRNVIERAVLVCDSDLIGLEHLPSGLMNSAAKSKHVIAGGYQVGDLVSLEVIEDAHIAKVLASAKTLRGAAAILGVNYSALCRRLRRNQTESKDHDKPAE